MNSLHLVLFCWVVLVFQHFTKGVVSHCFKDSGCFCSSWLEGWSSLQTNPLLFDDDDVVGGGGGDGGCCLMWNRWSFIICRQNICPAISVCLGDQLHQNCFILKHLSQIRFCALCKASMYRWFTHFSEPNKPLQALFCLFVLSFLVVQFHPVLPPAWHHSGADTARILPVIPLG